MSALLIDAQSQAAPKLLSIGELAQRTGVPASALRYYDELGFVRPTARESARAAAAMPRRPWQRSA